MADTEKNLEALEAVAIEENSMADAPKKNAVAAEPNHLSNEAEDLGAAVVKPTDSNPDATKKVKEVSGQAPQKSEGAPDPMPKLDDKHPSKAMESTETENSEDKEISEGEMPAGLKKYLDKKDDKKSDDKEESYKSKKEDKDVDVKEHVDALIAGETDLSEEFKDKAATIFETAIKSKVKEIAEEIEADYNNKFEQEMSTAKDELVEKVDSYLSYVVEQWMKENEIALERGIKGEIAEDFIGGLKKLFEDHYIDVPDEKYDVLEAQAAKVDDLQKKLDEQISKNVELNQGAKDLQRKEIVAEASADLADTSKEKFTKLVEEIEYSSNEDFKKKVETVKQSYFGKSTVSEDLDDVAAGESTLNSDDLSSSMAAYTAAISKTKDMKISIK
jgi:hypothetical protein|tara:strand:- start:492 stop:1655 length:1164 start_codon:yes stop_codon:yes gene_type:complete